MPFKLFSKKEDKFQRAFRKATEQEGVKIKEMDGEKAVIAKNGKTLTVLFADIRANWTNVDPRLRQPMMEHFVKGYVSLLLRDEYAPLETIKSKLMPAVRGGLYEGTDENPVYGDVLPEPLLTFLAVDEEYGMWFIQQKHLDNWKTTFDELLPIALENLRKSSNRGWWTRMDVAPCVQVYASEDGYDASRILILKELIDPWPPVGVAVAVPTRDMLVCVKLDETCLLHEPGALNWLQRGLASAAVIHQRSGYPIYSGAFWFDGEQWMPIFRAEKDANVIWILPYEMRERLEKLTEAK